MNMPGPLAGINTTTHLVMPIEENLSPLLPPADSFDFKRKAIQMLAVTALPIN